MLIGIVGKPSCGKSTLFKAATLANVEIANYPFTTIKPNHAIGFVKTKCVDTFFSVQCNPRFGFCKDHYRFIPINMIDVAGLVPDAHKGEGMGAQFLNDLNQADVLIHVVDMSGSINEKGEPVPALSYDPYNDVKFLEKELDFWYLDILKRGWERFARQIQQEHLNVIKSLTKQLSGLGVTEEMVSATIKKANIDELHPISWNEDNLFFIASELRKLTKPMIIAGNKMDIPGADANFERLKKEFPEYTFVACSAESELALREADNHGLISYVPGDSDFTIKAPEKLNPAQTKALEFIRANVLKKFGSTGLQQLLNEAVFGVLKYIVIYPGGVNKLADSDGRILPDSFLLKSGSTALDFAFKLHTDFGNKFICAIDVKTKMRVGKTHLLKDGDVVEIVADK